MSPRRRSFRRPNRSSGTTLRWVANTRVTQVMEVGAGGVSTADLTPGSGTTEGPWLGGTSEPTLLRIRGVWGGLPRTATNVASGGVREVRSIAILLAWRQEGSPTLNPSIAADVANEGVIYNDVMYWDTRDFVIPAAAAPANPFTVNIAGPAVYGRIIDVKARRRVRNEFDRLILSAVAHEIFTQSTPPTTSGSQAISAMLLWSMRFLYRTSR